LILLDTHVVLWLALEPARISKRARAAIDLARQGGTGVAISAITLLEIARLSSEGQIQLNASLDTFLSDVERRFTVLPISGRVCVRAVSFPATYPKDPADKVIGATALEEGISLVTTDRGIINSHSVSTIW
jgi:PIN domain nuclease of toxin-antitoxin system